MKFAVLILSVLLVSCLDTPSDTTPPGEVTNLAGSTGDGYVDLSWIDPADEDLANILIYFSPSASGISQPVSVSKGDQSRRVTGLSTDTAYEFTVKTVDEAGNKSAGVTAGVSTLPAQGLVGEWLFSGNADDTSGNGNSGTVSEAVLTTDRFGTVDSAYSFDGANDYIIADGDTLPTTDRTVSLWFYTDSIISYPAFTLLGYGGGGCGTSWFIFLYSTSSPVTIGTTEHCGENTFTYDFDSAPQGAWYHFTATTDSSGVVYYVNGQSIASTSAVLYATATAGTDLLIGTCVTANGVGAYTDGNVTYFAGKLDDIRIYNKALSASEISTLYHEGGWAQ